MPASHYAVSKFITLVRKLLPYKMMLHILHRLLLNSTLQHLAIVGIIILGGAAVGAGRPASVMNIDNTIQDSLKSKKPTALRAPMTLEESAIAQVAYMINCRACHGVDRMGASAPSLYKLNNRVTFNEFITVVDAGRSQMPGFPLLNDKTRIALYKYLSEIPILPDQKPAGTEPKKQ